MISQSDNYRCPVCKESNFRTSMTQWSCFSCNTTYPCISGIPRLYVEEKVGLHDRNLRDHFYDGIFGIWYSFMMPFIVLPVRPISMSLRHWGILVAFYALLAVLLAGLFSGISSGAVLQSVVFGIALVAMGLLLVKQKYLAYLLLLAIPTKISLAFSKFKHEESFAEVHARELKAIKGDGLTKLRILDVSTGSCNSLYKHGWMDLNAEYTGIDLSATMLIQGQQLMAGRNIAVDLVLGDAMDLPFMDNTFDVVLNYGAINGMADPGMAIREMARVVKPGGRILFLDEQMYGDASTTEKMYFDKVLSGHNVIHHCPLELMPPSLTDIRMSQIYEFYYICTARKSAS